MASWSLLMVCYCKYNKVNFRFLLRREGNEVDNSKFQEDPNVTEDLVCLLRTTYRSGSTEFFFCLASD